MQWSNVKLIFFREVRDQLRDRRTLFMIAVLPLLLYPLLGMSLFQVSQFMREQASKILIVGLPNLDGLPPLVEGDHFQARWLPEAEKKKSNLCEITFEPYADVADAAGPAQAEARIRKLVQEGNYELAVEFPANFRQRLDGLRAELAHRGNATTADAAPLQVPRPKIVYSTAIEKSRLAHVRAFTALRNWAFAVSEQNLHDSNLPVAAARPVEFASTDIAEPQQRSAALWSKILPFVLLIWALTGAFYPAIDLCAGEKERGTLETLLSSPALRSEIVTGKLLTVMLFSVATSLLNLMSMGVTGGFVIANIPLPDVTDRFGLPPLLSFLWLVIALAPVSALFGALCIALASFARSSKEGQYYLMPLVLITLPLVILPMAPGVELTLGNSLIPITGLMLLLKSLLEGNYSAVLPFIVPVVGVTLVCCVIAVRWAVDQFNQESVLFRESERLDLGLWLQHLRRDRGDTPSVSEALFCGVMILLIRFFISLAIQSPIFADRDPTAQLAMQIIVTQLVVIATPALLMTVMLTRSPGQTLSLRMPKWWTMPGAVLLALALHPAVKLLQSAIVQLYPLPESLKDSIELFGKHQPGLFASLVLIALLPAVCEELAFRGFILSGLRHLGHKWRAIALSSIMFGITHTVLQQSLVTSIVGAVIGYVAVQSGSIFPAMLFHFTHNASTVIVLHCYGDPELKTQFRPYIQDLGKDDFIYQWWVFGFGLIVAGWLLVKFSDLSYRKSDEEAIEESIERRVAELNA
ncbi:MAG: CPBP family intramembrane metalloprotease [Pirellulales bacterium]|nr:CPBP family intramembrane metalloprotease [Pirellulales bacterium]